MQRIAIMHEQSPVQRSSDHGQSASTTSAVPGSGLREIGWSSLEIVLAIVLLFIVIVTCVDVVGRYLFNRPLGGADELTAYGMALIIFGGLPLAARKREHVSVDIVTTSLPDTIQRGLQFVVCVAVTVSLTYLSLRFWILSGQFEAMGDSSTILRLPYAPLAAAMGGLALLAAAVTLTMEIPRAPARVTEDKK
jgi:TRAP-type C4-dicarboxylate transport system permease small subunit